MGTARQPSGARPSSAAAREALLRDPLDAERHVELARALLADGYARFAVACARGALALGADDGARAVLAAALDAAGWRDPARVLAALDHNRHFRLRTLATRLRERHGSAVSVLDVGGGDGELALFLPEARYVLAEPYVTGLSGEALPFAPESFDAVVACHVLEHVPEDARAGFLDGLLACARDTVLLLGPFHVPGARQRELLELALAVTGEAWAREHLECGLPALDQVRAWAAARDLACRVEANGSLHLAHALVHARHAVRAADGRGLAAFEAFLNAADLDELTSARRPAAHLVELQRRTPAR